MKVHNDHFQNQNIIISLALSLFFTFNLFVFGPLELYLTNINELWFSIGNLLPCVAISGIIVFIIIFCISYLQKNSSRIYQCLIFGATLGFYIQGNLMNVTYGVLDGRTINWEHYASWGIINTFIWITCFGLPLVLMRLKKEILTKLIVLGSLFISSIQLVTLIVLLVSTPLDKEDFYLTNENQFVLSNDQNVIVFIIDTFDNTVFQKVFEDEPSLIKQFKGFTYFKNTAGSYPTTKGVMPFLLTGQHYRNEMPYEEYLKESYNNTSFYRELKNQNFDIRLYTLPLFLSKDQGNLISNEAYGTIKVKSYTDLEKLMYKFTFFRYMPHYLKKYFWLYTDEFNTIDKSINEKEYYGSNIRFYEYLKRGISLNNEKAFRLYHIAGMHPPYNMNENIENVGDGNATVTDQAKGCLNIVLEYIKQLEALGVYDNTTIIITADHGYVTGEPTVPIMLVKQKRTVTGFNVSDAPVSQEDLQATIMSDITPYHKQFGDSMFDIPENAERTRSYYYYSWDDSWVANYLPDMTEYKVVGDASDLMNYWPTGKTYTSEGIKISDIAIGEEITFDKNGRVKELFPGRFWESEGDYCWSKGTRSTLSLYFHERPQKNLIASIKYSMIYGASQQLTIKCNGKILFEKNITEPGEIKFNIPNELIDGKSATLELEMPNAVSPASVGSSNGDVRILAFAFTSMKFEEEK
jgi:hypothetical protein